MHCCKFLRNSSPPDRVRNIEINIQSTVKSNADIFGDFSADQIINESPPKDSHGPYSQTDTMAEGWDSAAESTHSQHCFECSALAPAQSPRRWWLAGPLFAEEEGAEEDAEPHHDEVQAGRHL